MGLIITLLIGAVAGWLAGVIMKGGGFGIIVNIILGIVGAWVGTYLFGVLGVPVIGTALVNTLIASTAGAVVILFIIGLIKK